MSGRSRLENRIYVALVTCARKKCSTKFWAGYHIDKDDCKRFLSVVDFEQTTDIPQRKIQWINETSEAFNWSDTSKRTSTTKEASSGNAQFSVTVDSSEGAKGTLDAGGTKTTERNETEEQQRHPTTYPPTAHGEHRTGNHLEVIKHKAHVRPEIGVRVYRLKHLKVGAGVSGGLGATVGTAGGATAGAVIGAFAGSVVPVLGNIIGGIAGGVIGGIGGAAVGTAAIGGAGTGISACVSYNDHVIITGKEVLQEFPDFKCDNDNDASCTVLIDRPVYVESVKHLNTGK